MSNEFALFFVSACILLTGFINYNMGYAFGYSSGRDRVFEDLNSRTPSVDNNPVISSEFTGIIRYRDKRGMDHLLFNYKGDRYDFLDSRSN